MSNGLEGIVTAEPRYPLGEMPAGSLFTPTGLPLEEITLEAVLDGSLGAQDLRISRDTLILQAEIAEGSGFTQLGQNLRRAAEMASIPDHEILQIYTALRPRRSTYAGLIQLAADLENRYAASLLADFIREAAGAYRARRLTRDDPPFGSQG